MAMDMENFCSALRPNLYGEAMSARSTAPRIVAAVARDSTGPCSEHQVSWRHGRLSRICGTMAYWRDEGCVSVMRTFNAMFVV